MNIIPLRKRDDVATFRDAFDDLWTRFLGDDFDGNGATVSRGTMAPPVNIAETEKGWTISFELPGMNEKDIQVQLMGGQLVVSGERKWEEEKKGKEYRRVESRYGAFERSITLPENARLDSDALSASYKNGILEITVPKVEPTPAAKIPVKAG